MRVGAVTHRGYGELVLQRYGRVWGWFGAGDLHAHQPRHPDRRVRRHPRRARLLPPRLRRGRRARAGAGRRSPSAAGATGAGSASCSAWPLFNGLFLLAAILVKPHVGSDRRLASTSAPFPGGSFNTLLLLLASTIGATVTPWMIFFQQSASADKGMTPSDVSTAATTPRLGAVLAAVFGVGALIAGAALLGHTADGHPGVRRRRLSGGAQARRGRRRRNRVRARADRGRGRGHPHDLRQHRLRGRRMHRRLAQLQHAPRATPPSSTRRTSASRCSRRVVILIPGAPLLSIALNANVLATVLLPVSLVFMVMLANDRGLMGRVGEQALHQRDRDQR